MRYFGQMSMAPPLIIAFVALLGLFYAAVTFVYSVATTKLVEPESGAHLAQRKDADVDVPESQDPEQAALMSEEGDEKSNAQIVADMIRISDAIADGARAFMIAEFYVGIFF